MKWIAEDYVTIKQGMPAPKSDGTVRARRNTGSRSFGHPREWASDMLAEIADKLHGWADALREHLGHALAVHPNASEPRRVAVALQYLEAWFDELCLYPGAQDAAVELSEMHTAVRRALGRSPQKQHLPAPCPECDLLMLFRIVGGGLDLVECQGCGAVLDAANYLSHTRNVVDGLIEASVDHRVA